MKKIKRLLPLLLACVLLLSGCGALREAMQEADELPVKEYINAVSSGDTETVRSLTHPSAAGNKETFERNISTLQAYLDGRTATAMKRGSVNVNTQVSLNAGKTKTLNVEYTVELSDGTEVPVTVVYLTDGTGEGFSSLVVQLGVG